MMTPSTSVALAGQYTNAASAEHIDTSDLGPTGSKKKISKAELIAYLKNVQIVDEDGEIAQLKAECLQLRKQLDEKDYELLKLERQRAYLQKQCDEIQRDMDTLIEAMQIAKRRGHVSSQVIDADVRTE